jgi:hypothetical protein
MPGYHPGDENNLPQATLLTPDKPQDLGGRDAPPPGQEDKPGTDWRHFILWGILLIGVALLAWMAATLIRTPDASH